MRWLIGMVVVVVAVGAVVGVLGYRWWAAQVERDRAIQAAESFVAAWESADGDALAAATGGNAEAADAHLATRERLAPDAVTVELTDVDVAAAGDGRASATTETEWDLGLLGTWSHAGDVRLQRDEATEAWAVAWTPTALHADLETGTRLQRVDRWPNRAPITTADGTVLAGPGDVLEVGVEPQAVGDADAVAEAVGDHSGATPESVRDLLERDDLEPDWFYPVAELSADADEDAEALRGVPGVVVREGAGREVGEPALASLVGTVGEITAEQLEQLGAPYDVGDTVGVSGIERVYERRLAGDPGGEIRIVDDDGAVVEVLHEVAHTEPASLAVTLDADVQRAADLAMDRVGSEGALVAVDVATGGLAAAVDRPTGGFPRGRAGSYAPGSTFKVVTAAALLQHGLAPDSLVECPAMISAAGRQFRNAGGLQLGPITFTEAFAESCNTAFIGAAQDLPDGALVDAAAQLGFGTDYTLLGAAVASAFPEPADGAEYAAQAIGQGRIDVAPAHMASVAAAVASGTWRQPHVLVDEGDVATGEPLDEAVVEALASLQREVVTSGTGTAAAVEGVTVRGKTGTAEFDGGEHAWFIGSTDDLAFAVLVEGGGAGGGVAAPIAAEFVGALP